MMKLVDAVSGRRGAGWIVKVLIFWKRLFKMSLTKHHDEVKAYGDVENTPAHS